MNSAWVFVDKLAQGKELQAQGVLLTDEGACALCGRLRPVKKSAQAYMPRRNPG
jgi:hypothetical protein